MKEKHEIIEELCKPYGGFADVVTRYGATFISQLWMKSMDLYAEQSRQADVSGSLPDELLLAAIKYGYDYHSTTSFPNESFEVNMLGNALQWIENNRQ